MSKIFKVMVFGLFISLMVIGLTQLNSADKITIPGKRRAVAVLKNGLVQFACNAYSNSECITSIEQLQ